LVIAPRRLPWPEAMPDRRPLVHSGSEELRAVRPFVTGDALKLVHWPTTARSGELVVRELEEPKGTITIVVDLGDGKRRQATEAVAGGAAWVVEALLDEGWTVRLVTAEGGGTVAEVVETPIDVGRRLAVAVPGRPSYVPAGGEPTHLLAGR
jgi:uncharacterized protein (DUF58 family)